MQRVNLQPAYVIHTRAFRDTSLIVEVFTPEYGRVSLLSRGAKTGKAQKALLLQPFRALHLSWAGRGELPALSAVEETGNSLRLSGESLACGYYVNELIYHLLPRDEPAASLFADYWPILLSITDPSQRDEALRSFEFKLLDQLGYTPQLDCDIATGEPVRSGVTYRFQVPDGPSQVMDDASDTAADRTLLLVDGGTLLDLHQRRFNSIADERKVRDLMRALIHYHLDGRELQSRALFTSFKKIARKET